MLLLIAQEMINVSAKVLFIKEQNDLLFQAELQKIFDNYSDVYNIDVQYQHIRHSGVNITSTFYTALVIMRRK